MDAEIWQFIVTGLVGLIFGALGMSKKKSPKDKKE